MARARETRSDYLNPLPTPRKPLISEKPTPTTKQTKPRAASIIYMKSLYELATENELDIKPGYFTTLYLIEKHISQKTMNLTELLTLIFIIT